MALDPIVTVGAAIGHSAFDAPADRINRGDTALIELGANIHRYTAASFRCAIVGQPSEQLTFMSDGCIASLEAMIGAMKPGANRHGDRPRRRPSVARRRRRGILWHGYYAYHWGSGFRLTGTTVRR